MNHHHIAIPLLIAGILLSAPLRTSAAPGAAVKSVAAKPKLAPRPLPGTSGGAAPAVSEPLKTTVTRVAQKAPATATAGNAVPETRIVMIYRNGAPGIPALPSATAASSGSAEPELLQPTSLTNPRPGQVRIISKAEADALAAQPQP